MTAMSPTHRILDRMLGLFLTWENSLSGNIPQRKVMAAMASRVITWAAHSPEEVAAADLLRDEGDPDHLAPGLLQAGPRPQEAQRRRSQASLHRPLPSPLHHSLATPPRLQSEPAPAPRLTLQSGGKAASPP